MEKFHPFLYSPLIWLFLFLVSALLMTGIDFLLGKNAEYLNAWHFILALLQGSAANDLKYIYNQSELGRLALPLTAVLLVLIHSLSATVLTILLRKYFC